MLEMILTGLVILCLACVALPVVLGVLRFLPQFAMGALQWALIAAAWPIILVLIGGPFR